MGAGMPSTFQAESCLTLDPPHPSCEKRASRTEFNCSKCLEVDPLEAEAVDVGGGSFVVAGNPLPAAAAHEVCVGGPAGPEAGVELAGC